MKNAEKPRKIVVAVVARNAVRARHLRAAAQRVVAKSEAAAPSERRWRSKRLRAIQGVIPIPASQTPFFRESSQYVSALDTIKNVNFESVNLA